MSVSFLLPGQGEEDAQGAGTTPVARAVAQQFFTCSSLIQIFIEQDARPHVNTSPGAFTVAGLQNTDYPGGNT
jgi:hypothetical protein